MLKPSLNWLLVFVPIAVVLRVWPQLGNETALFICSCLAVVPLAGWMGRATEELAEHLGHGIGGLLNATFGNAAELIIALMALSKGLTGVVKASIIGSIIGNVLLVMGVSIVGGGVKFREQRFNKTAARASATTLTLAAVALAVPTVFHVTTAGRSGGWSQATEQKLSLAIAAGLGLGGNESYPDLFQPFGGFPDGVRVEDGHVVLPDLPGIGFEGKADLYRQMKVLSD